MLEAKRTLYDSSRIARWKKGGPEGTTMAQVVVVGHDERNRENWTGRLSLLFPFVMKCNAEVPPERRCSKPPTAVANDGRGLCLFHSWTASGEQRHLPAFRDFDIVHPKSFSRLYRDD